MSIYIFLGITLIFFSYLEIFSENFRAGKNRKIFYLILIAVGAIFMSRWFVGWDWYNYYPHFQGESQNFEKGYAIFVELTRKFTGEYEVFVALNTLIDCFFLFWVIPRYSSYPITTLMLYLGVNGLALEVDIMRNVKSILLFLLSLEFIERKEHFRKRGFIAFLALNILGAFFHITSLIYIPLYFLLPISYKKRVVIGVFILGNLYYFSNLNILEILFRYIPYERFQGYLAFIKSGRGELNIFYWERVIMFIFAFFSSNFIENKKLEKYRIFQNSVYLTIYIFLYFKDFPIIALRFFLLFSFSYWYIFPIFLDSLDWNFKRNTGVKIGVFLLIVGITFFRTYNFLSFSGNRIVYPYENYFLRKTSKEEKEKNLREALKYRGNGIEREILLLY